VAAASGFPSAPSTSARLVLGEVKAAKLGYAVRAERWGKGYATDAARCMIAFGFKELRLHRISAAVGPDNARSIAVVHKLGLQCEGRIRDTCSLTAPSARLVVARRLGARVDGMAEQKL
jgi:RimJ/RimL family protein N-acetyltransferase